MIRRQLQRLPGVPLTADPVEESTPVRTTFRKRNNCVGLDIASVFYVVMRYRRNEDKVFFEHRVTL